MKNTQIKKVMFKHISFILIGVSLILTSCSQKATTSQIINFSPNGQGGDITQEIRTAIDNSSKTLHLHFAAGDYSFKPDFASDHYEAIINHDNGLKKIVFNIQDFDNVIIEGENADFYFHGQEMPFQFKRCKNVSVSGIRIHWDIPFLFAGKVVAVNKKEGWRDLKPVNPKGQWKISKGRLLWPNIDGFNFLQLGSTLAFTADTKRPVDGCVDHFTQETKVEKRPNGIVRIYEKMKVYPPVGSILNSKGDKANDRYAPAFRFCESSNINIKNVIVHHALGMGYLFEFCENITLDHSGVYLEKDSPEVVSSTADATHFANCKGQITMTHCRFENMLDDGTNVHGTYVSVNKKVDEHTLRVALMHQEQIGGTFAMPNDSIWFIHQPNPNRIKEIGKIKNISIINEKYQDITFYSPIPESIKAGDLLENKTWNPSLTIDHCIFRNNRARNIIIKTPKPILIEENELSSMMSTIMLRGESYYWFESGAVCDVMIRNNHITHSAYCGKPHAILYVTPRLGEHFDHHAYYDRNISFINNTIENFQPRIVWAYNVEGLTIKGNKITQTYETIPTQGDAAQYEIHDCKDIIIENNIYKGKRVKTLSIDDKSKQTLVIKNN